MLLGALSYLVATSVPALSSWYLLTGSACLQQVQAIMQVNLQPA